MQNCDFWVRTTSLYESQNSPVVLCMQNNLISIKITSLYGSQPSLMFFFAFKTASLAPELQVSMVPAIICGFVHSKQRHYDQN